MTYERADADMMDAFKQAWAIECHAPLRNYEVKVGVIAAHQPRDKNDDPTGPAVKAYGGHPALATIKVVSLKDRLIKGYDAEIVVDADEWLALTDGQRVALMDHELTHLELKADKEGCVQRDDLDRPRLKLRSDGYALWGFPEVAKRHGEQSIEVKAAREFHEKYGQLLFAWG